MSCRLLHGRGAPHRTSDAALRIAPARRQLSSSSLAPEDPVQRIPGGAEELLHRARLPLAGRDTAEARRLPSLTKERTFLFRPLRRERDRQPVPWPRQLPLSPSARDKQPCACAQQPGRGGLETRREPHGTAQDEAGTASSMALPEEIGESAVPLLTPQPSAAGTADDRAVAEHGGRRRLKSRDSIGSYSDSSGERGAPSPLAPEGALGHPDPAVASVNHLPPLRKEHRILSLLKGLRSALPDKQHWCSQRVVEANPGTGQCPVTPCSCPEPCLEDWTYFRKTCYHFNKTESNWSISQGHCSSHNASLALFTSNRELDYLLTVCKNDCWIGLRKKGNAFQWTDGTPYQSPVEIHGQEECVYIKDQKMLSTSDCTLPRTYICTRAGASPGTLA
ncbi:uncharacterized protein LOC115077932 isoform X2 [Rhinatrema bivittatum]|uniref:uncharacterized protein LOC115077932 isoform X2 n=1 Tax=Rhinatrema bivittatum TaxID=194408 RepID=UPI00112A93BE|nr:uncharacterized protein LOC115077932 isoform X2 [Rhinatrema bivittatum]